MVKFGFYKFLDDTTAAMLYEADEGEGIQNPDVDFDFKELSNGKIAQKIVFVNNNAEIIKLFK